MMKNFFVDVIVEPASCTFLHLRCEICSRQRKAAKSRFHFGMLCGPRSVIVAQVVPMSAGAGLACLPARLQLSLLVIEVYISLSEVVFACVLLILQQLILHFQLKLVLHMRHYLASL